MLNGDKVAAQEAAGRMKTGSDRFVGSFEYAGELHLEFGGSMEGSGDDGKGPLGQEEGRGAVDGYIRHLHLNNATGESVWFLVLSAEGLSRVPGTALSLG